LAGEKKCSSALGLLGNVDFALLEALNQIMRGEINQFDRIGAVENSIRYRLADAHMGDLGDHIVEAFDVLDVDGGVDVDAVRHQLFDVEIALGMPAAGCVGMGELVDQNDLRPAGDDGVEIHLVEPLPLVGHAPARDDLKPLQQRLGLRAAMGFHHADHDIVAVPLTGAGLLEHLVGLADAGRSADENSEPADAPFLPSGRFQQCFR
jgi:hypothetical protein